MDIDAIDKTFNAINRIKSPEKDRLTEKMQDRLNTLVEQQRAASKKRKELKTPNLAQGNPPSSTQPTKITTTPSPPVQPSKTGLFNNLYRLGATA